MRLSSGVVETSTRGGRLRTASIRTLRIAAISTPSGWQNHGANVVRVWRAPRYLNRAIVMVSVDGLRQMWCFRFAVGNRRTSLLDGRRYGSRSVPRVQLAAVLGQWLMKCATFARARSERRQGQNP